MRDSRISDGRGDSGSEDFDCSSCESSTAAKARAEEADARVEEADEAVRQDTGEGTCCETSTPNSRSGRMDSAGGDMDRPPPAASEAEARGESESDHAGGVPKSLAAHGKLHGAANAEAGPRGGTAAGTAERPPARRDVASQEGAGSQGPSPEQPKGAAVAGGASDSRSRRGCICLDCFGGGRRGERDLEPAGAGR
jgi:hypothetical protein